MTFSDLVNNSLIDNYTHIKIIYDDQYINDNYVMCGRFGDLSMSIYEKILNRQVCGISADIKSSIDDEHIPILCITLERS